MDKGYLHAVVIVVLSTLAGLLALHFLPSIQAGEWQMRDIDLVADLRDSTYNDDELALTTKHAYVDSCRPDLECINDMSGSQSQGMEPLYDAIDSINNLGRPIRIAVLGDSYIEGDILTAHLRERLQHRWGGSGVGFVPIADPIAGFRTTVAHQSGGWKAHNANEPGSGYQPAFANITGHYFTGASGAWLRLAGVKKDVNYIDTCSQSSLYFAGTGSATVAASINNGEEQRFDITAAGDVKSVTVGGRIGAIRWRIIQNSGLVFLGASMDPDKGFVVDNYALRSSSGTQLKMVSDKMFSDFDKARHYDLVVIMFGLNVAGRNTTNYDGYSQTMSSIIETMKRAMPETGFLLIGSTDREERTPGGYRTIKGVLSLINAQQQMAYDTNIAFWNLYNAMGGQGSVVEMVKNHEANLDYTHINFSGGKRLSAFLFDAIDWGYQSYTL